jgi:hypothetical protein
MFDPTDWALLVAHLRPAVALSARRKSTPVAAIALAAVATTTQEKPPATVATTPTPQRRLALWAHRASLWTRGLKRAKLTPLLFCGLALARRGPNQKAPVLLTPGPLRLHQTLTDPHRAPSARMMLSRRHAFSFLRF